MAVSDFGGMDFVGGSIFGIRAWNFDRARAVLVSPTKTSFCWNPNENVADCNAGERQVEQFFASRDKLESILMEKFLPPKTKILSLRTILDRNGVSLVIGLFAESEIVGHPAMDFPDDRVYPRELKFVEGGYEAELVMYWKIFSEHLPKVFMPHDLNKCSCGFYAYTDRHNSNAGVGYIRTSDYGYEYGHYKNKTVIPVSGVIEGYGQVTVGPYGFRAQKAKIVAMYLPDIALVKEVGDIYPNVFFFETEDKMLAEFPLGVRDLSA